MTTNDSQLGMPREWTGSFSLDGMEYRCNEVNPAPVNRMGGVMMDLGGQDTVTSDGANHLIVIPVNHKIAVISFMVHTINKYVKPDQMQPLVVGIYRKGEPEPIFYKEYDTLKDEILDLVSDYEVVPGEYIMAMGNIAPYDSEQGKFMKAGDFYIFRMSVLEHGENVSHPLLLNAYMDEELLVNIMFKYEHDVSQELLTCECYDEDFRQVTEMEPMECMDDFSNCVTALLHNKERWVDGDYHLIVYHNSEPFAHVRFITMDGESSVVWSDTLSHDSVFYKLCKDVQASGHKHMFNQLNGCGKLKKKVLDYLCQEHHHVNEHLMFAATGKPEYDVMNTMTGIMHPRYGYQIKTVKELMNEVSCVPDELETLDVMLARHSTVIHELNDLTHPFNEWFARLLLKVAAKRHGFIVLYGTPAELKRVLDMYPQWVDYLLSPLWWNVYTFTSLDGVRTVEHILEGKKLELTNTAYDKLTEVIHDNWEMLREWRKKDYEEWVNTEILLNFKKRILSEDSFSDIFLATVLADDVTLTIHQENEQESFNFSLSGLERMVGLTDVKEHLKMLFKRMDFERKREKLGLKKLHAGRPHMVFTGNPGTGKTTVAKLIGQAFKQMGYLSQGEVMAVERAQMVGPHIGSTETRMKELLKKAKGNVLFIDEAYSLCDNNEGDRKDYGCRVLECLLPVLADADSDIIVVLAGYEKEMDEMMKLNPGMRGRFPFWFKFEDYDAAELHEIAKRLLEDNDYQLSSDASMKLRACIGEALKMKDRYFHNARWITQLVQDGILVMMAERLYGTDAVELNRDLFLTVTEEDVIKGFAMMRSDKKRVPVRRVGFR